MSSTIYAKGIVSADKTDSETSKKIQICKLCEEFGIEPPKELMTFWYSIETTEEGDAMVDLPIEATTEVQLCGMKYIEVDIEKIPKEITKLRFIHAY